MNSEHMELIEELKQINTLQEYLGDYDEDAMKELLTRELGEDHPLIMAIIADSCDPGGGTILSELLEVTLNSLKAEKKELEVRRKYTSEG